MNHRVQVLSPEGQFLRKFGSKGSGDGQLTNPTNIATDAAGNVYVTDANHRVQVFDLEGNYLRKWGSEGSDDGQFQNPSGIAVDPFGNVYVFDTSNFRIQVFTSDGEFIRKWGSEGSNDGQFKLSGNVEVDDAGNVYVADLNNRRVQVFDTEGKFIRQVGESGGGDGQFRGPGHMAIDAAGNIYVNDLRDNRIQIFSPTGKFLGKWGSEGTADGQFNSARGIAVDDAGRIYVADFWNHRIQVFEVELNQLATPIVTPTVVPVFAVDVEAGYSQTCALSDSGGVRCWGNNDTGQIGLGRWYGTYKKPVDVAGLSSGVTAIAAAEMSTQVCALIDSGGVKCWGGRTSNAPVGIVGLDSGVIAISSGRSLTCAQMNFGEVKCWGGNSNGQLGNGTTTNSNVPVDVIGLTGSIVDVSAGGVHACAVNDQGGVQCWGSNKFGQLGDGTKTDSATPTNVVGLSGGATAVAAGTEHTCALMSAGGVQCWGNGAMLGSGTFASSNKPVDVVELVGGVTSIETGRSHTCAVMATSGLRCWGGNFSGQLGNGEDTGTTANPQNVTGLARGVIDVSGGRLHTCAVTSLGSVKCWGENDDGQIGDGSTTSRTTPVDVFGYITTQAASP